MRMSYGIRLQIERIHLITLLVSKRYFSLIIFKTKTVRKITIVVSIKMRILNADYHFES